jgi:hypothetical protein
VIARRALGPLAALALSACGASSAQRPASAPAGGADQKSEEAAPDESQPGYQRQAYPEEPAPAPAPTFAQPPAEPTLGSAADAQVALDRGEQELASALSSGGDCRTACKAMGSMQRARDRICELNGADDPGRRCATARQRVDEAADRLRRGACTC